MPLGDKLSNLRKENNYTQEQLADVLGVSRQSVSKWESNLACPETDKLIRMSEMFHCSLDYLLKDGEETDSIQQDDSENTFTKSWILKNKKKWMIAIDVILLILAIATILPRWNEIWYDFGRNIYHFFNS